MSLLLSRARPLACLTLLLLLGACAAPRPPAPPPEQTRSAAASPSFTLPLPPGFRTETIPFPLGFAPDLPYRGVEELRFAPGMFQPGAPDFWSYAFVWWLEGNPSFTGDSL